MSFVLDLLNFAVYLPFLKPDEEDISRNITTLKRYEWFKVYYQNEQYAQLIIHNENVRKMLMWKASRNRFPLLYHPGISALTATGSLPAWE